MSSNVPFVQGGFVAQAGFAYGVNGGETEHFAGSAAAAFAASGITPAPNVSELPPGNVPHVEGTGSPLGNTVPTAIGEQYEDIKTGSIWIANGLTASSWTEVSTKA